MLTKKEWANLKKAYPSTTPVFCIWKHELDDFNTIKPVMFAQWLRNILPEGISYEAVNHLIVVFEGWQEFLHKQVQIARDEPAEKVYETCEGCDYYYLDRCFPCCMIDPNPVRRYPHWPKCHRFKKATFKAKD